ncbi:MAG: hypothetical protein RQ899_02705 [Pseudomonadales bacterium]|nr:hypothetical protein [Pseudomonadales bacterium]
MRLQTCAHTFKTIVLTTGIALCGLASSATFAQACDRACLAGLMTQYVDALVAHDHTRLPLADAVKYTVDGLTGKLGEGIWQSVTGAQGFRQDYLDLKQQVAASHVVFDEGENQILLSVLLHVNGEQKINGIETLIQHITPSSRFQPRELGAPIRGMNDPIPEGEKMSRANMVRIALTYPEGLRIGNFTDGGTPFAVDCYRVENGVITAEGPGMFGQNIIVHPGIIASVAAVDEENGTVLLWMNFGHTGDSYGVGNSLLTYEAFKVWGNQIHSINAFFTSLPISRSRFWPSSDPVYK